RSTWLRRRASASSARVRVRLAEGDFEGERGDGVQQELTDGEVDGGAGHGVTGRHAVLDGLTHAEIVGHLDTVSEVIADSHASPAPAAHGQSLQEGGSFTGGTGATVAAVGLGV